MSIVFCAKPKARATPRVAAGQAHGRQGQRGALRAADHAGAARARRRRHVVHRVHGPSENAPRRAVRPFLRALG